MTFSAERRHSMPVVVDPGKEAFSTSFRWMTHHHHFPSQSDNNFFYLCITWWNRELCNKNRKIYWLVKRQKRASRASFFYKTKKKIREWAARRVEKKVWSIKKKLLLRNKNERADGNFTFLFLSWMWHGNSVERESRLSIASDASRENCVCVKVNCGWETKYCSGRRTWRTRFWMGICDD